LIKNKSFLVGVFALFVVAGGALAVGPWVMEWYSFDFIPDTGTHAAGIEEDWLAKIYGKSEAEFSKFGRVPAPGQKVTYNGAEMGWQVADLLDVNDDRNLSNGIYGEELGDMSNYVYYGIVIVTSPSDQDTVMHVAQDD